MATLIPVTQPTNVEAAYEDMFKEITRKLYGEETGNGLHTLGTPVAHVATSGPTAPEGERSFTTLMSDRSLAPTIEYEPNGGPETSQPNFKSEDHLTTAFGLAALMQNGFPATGAILNPQVIPKTSTIVTPATSSTAGVVNNTNTGAGGGGNGGGGTSNNTTLNTNNPTVTTNDQRWTNPPQDIMSWTGGKLASFNGAQKSNKSTKNRDQSNDLYHNTNSATNNTNTHTNNNSNRKNKNANNVSANNNNNNNNNNNTIQVQKRYSCTHCPYSTDRRDLYTRHENIHKDEKPFQCYACLKQFNRADHVKKHFLRMHRELTYDINKTRRQISTTEQKPGSFLHNTTGNNPQQQQQQITDGFMNTQRPSGSGTGGGGGVVGGSGQQESSSLSIAQTIESVATAQVSTLPTQLKQEKNTDDKTTVKVKREKRFSCCYCPWTGADKWGLKRHLNTHTKPFVCMLCDYKAARSERLATHVLKVHNKKACNKCSFLADNQEEYQAHMSDMHPHDQRPARNNNNSGNANNVLRAIGNSLITNNQLNNFQNPSTSFGSVQTSNSGVAIYTSNDLTGTGSTNNTNNTTTNGLQEIVVNPTSMVSWRLSATGSLIPPHIEPSVTNTANTTTTTTGSGIGSISSNQKRGAERLFQYLEADGSDPEDYARLLKMDAISRNTASVAQDFHNAGGVNFNNNNNNDNKNNNNNVNNNNNKKLTTSTKYLTPHIISAAAATTTSHLQYQINSNSITAELENSENVYDEIQFLKAMGLQRKAMSTMAKNNDNKIYHNYHQQQQRQQQLNKSPPAYNSTSNLNQPNKMMNTITNNNNNNSSLSMPLKGHRHNNHDDSMIREQEDKENSNSIFAHMEYENLSMIGIQFQNYVKEIINKYYAETPLLYPSSPQLMHHNITPTQTTTATSSTYNTNASTSNFISIKSKQQQQQQDHKFKTESDEAMEYIEYLKNKGDITLTIAPKIQESDITSSSISSSSSSSSSAAISISPVSSRSILSPSITSSTSTSLVLLPSYSSIVSQQCHHQLQQQSQQIDKNRYGGESKRARKQAQPRKIAKSDVIMARLRDKYLKKLVDPKKSCITCSNQKNSKQYKNQQAIITFPYHSYGSLALHSLWKHSMKKSIRCNLCRKKFLKNYSLKIHLRIKHKQPK